jgi:hypothetical protein
MSQRKSASRSVFHVHSRKQFHHVIRYSREFGHGVCQGWRPLAAERANRALTDIRCKGLEHAAYRGGLLREGLGEQGVRGVTDGELEQVCTETMVRRVWKMRCLSRSDRSNGLFGGLGLAGGGGKGGCYEGVGKHRDVSAKRRRVWFR